MTKNSTSIFDEASEFFERYKCISLAFLKYKFKISNSEAFEILKKLSKKFKPCCLSPNQLILYMQPEIPKNRIYKKKSKFIDVTIP